MLRLKCGIILMNQNIHCPLCSSIYEDAPYNYLIDYAFVNGGLPGLPVFAQLLGLNAAGERIFYYQYPASELWQDLSRFPRSFGKHKVPGSGSSSAKSFDARDSLER